MKKAKAKKISPVLGWLLITVDEDTPHDWYIAWDSPFSRKKDALDFARNNNWPRPYRAVRGGLVAS